MRPERSDRQGPDREAVRASRVWAAVTAAGLLWAVVALWWHLNPREPAPEVTFKTLGHGPIAMSSLRGQPVLVTFWATSCPTCIQEMPHLFSLYADYRGRGLEIVAVAMPYDPPNRVSRMARERGIPYPVAIDVLGEAARAFGGVEFTPSSFLISPDGRIVERRVGALDTDRARRLIDKLLAG